MQRCTQPAWSQGWRPLGNKGSWGAKDFQAPGGICSRFFQDPEALTHVHGGHPCRLLAMPRIIP